MAAAADLKQAIFSQKPKHMPIVSASDEVNLHSALS